MDLSQTPNWSALMFLSYFDSAEKASLKMEFFQKLDLTKTLHTVVSEGLETQVTALTKIATTFIHEIFDIQERLGEAFPDKINAAKSKLPFIHPYKPPCYSLASISLAIWERFFLEPNTIFCIPPRQKEDKSSKIEQHWAYLEAKKDDVDGEDVIHMAGTEIYQKRFQTKDGKCISYPDFYNANTKTIKWFHGCRFHSGCEKCQGKGDKKVEKDSTPEKFSEIKKHNRNDVGTKFEIAWECKVKEDMKKEDTNYVGRPLGRLQSRMAYRSGFSELMHHHFKKSRDFVLELWDCSSLYPYIAKTKKFNTGKFFVLTVLSIMKRVEITDTDILLDGQPFHGFCHAKIIPPKNNLSLPYLGMKVYLSNEEKSERNSHDKIFHSTARGQSRWKRQEHLTHPLCATCAKNQIWKCQHSDENRAILSVISGDEIRYMLSLGYILPKEFIYEMWVFDVKNKKKIFESYMSFIECEKIKASKIPKGFVGLEQEYCDAVNRELGNDEKLKLKPEHLKENPVRRGMLKSLVNNLFGRLGLKPYGSYSVYVKNEEELAKYMDKMHLVDDIFLRDDKLELILNEPAPFNKTNRRTNVLIASQINR